MRLSVPRPLAIDFDEALRYMGARREPSLLEDLAAVWRELEPRLEPAAAAVCLELSRREGRLFCGGLELAGRSAAARFAGCGRCAALGVTLGFEADRLISALGQSDPYRALLTDACATAAVEELADMATLAAREAFCPGSRITFRFSPGYGDLPLSLQPGLLELLDARRMLGLTVSRSMLLSPVKSVTAFAGLSEGSCGGDSMARHDCRSCFMGESCPYRMPK